MHLPLPQGGIIDIGGRGGKNAEKNAVGSNKISSLLNLALHVAFNSNSVSTQVHNSKIQAESKKEHIIFAFFTVSHHLF